MFWLDLPNVKIQVGKKNKGLRKKNIPNHF